MAQAAKHAFTTSRTETVTSVHSNQLGGKGRFRNDGHISAGRWTDESSEKARVLIWTPVALINHETKRAVRQVR